MMKRPTVQIDCPNQCSTLVAHLNNHLELFADLPGVVGITLNGGLARGYGDHLSEIDITIYLESDTYNRWLQGYASVGIGIQRIDGALYDIKIMNAAVENPKNWSEVARWDASYAQVLYDPTGRVADILSQINDYRPSPSNADGAMFSAWWHFKLAGDIWIHRNDPLQAHFVLNQAITDMLKALYMANSEFVPHDKWLIHMSRTLPWTPGNWNLRLSNILCQLEPTLENIKARQQHIKEIWDEIDAYLLSLTGEDGSLNLMYRKHHNLLKMLVEASSVSVRDWQQVSELALLNQAPFNLCTTIHKNQILLDHTKLAGLTSDDVYAWYYKVVQAVRDVHGVLSWYHNFYSKI